MSKIENFLTVWIHPNYLIMKRIHLSVILFTGGVLTVRGCWKENYPENERILRPRIFTVIAASLKDAIMCSGNCYGVESGTLFTNHLRWAISDRWNVIENGMPRTQFGVILKFMKTEDGPWEGEGAAKTGIQLLSIRAFEKSEEKNTLLLSGFRWNHSLFG